ncbi:hypothetical protein G6O69_22840 [Pseudenhygromyxa sp. WMMC2535]|uniref:hypothetical protein n=1 Tax=Pseudenhygromyxa sp. WMMC2535 TaxID=2712867 RepID=UPI00155479AE|nr:hypothetical protein [Pseudenhygromyxa sp. WMMC2535]NVB40694.1 hypothetical protein [Pseudenhygromyxa sp. WMMC2535]
MSRATTASSEPTPAPTPTPPATRPKDRWIAGVAMLISLVALGRWVMVSLDVELSLRRQRDESAQRYEPPPPPPPPPYLPAARALLGGLAPGEDLGHGWEVERVEGPLDDGSIGVLTLREGQRFRVWLRARGSDERLAPMHTERWDIYYDRPNPMVPKPDPRELSAVITAIAERVRANEGEG